MKRTPAKIKADIQTLKETLKVTEGEERKMIEDGIADLEKELAELEKSSEKEAEKAAKEDIEKEKGKPKPKKAKAEKAEKKSPAPKKSSKRFPERNKFYVDPSKKVNKLGAFHELHKHDEDTFAIVSTKSDVPKAQFDIVKKSGKFHVECRSGDKRTYNTLAGSVSATMKEIYKQDIKPLIEAKEKQIEASREWRKKNPNGLTPAKQIKKAVEKAAEKIEDKKDEGESTDKQEHAILKQIKELLKSLDEKYQRELYNTLKKKFEE